MSKMRATITATFSVEFDATDKAVRDKVNEFIGKVQDAKLPIEASDIVGLTVEARAPKFVTVREPKS